MSRDASRIPLEVYPVTNSTLTAWSPVTEASVQKSQRPSRDFVSSLSQTTHRFCVNKPATKRQTADLQNPHVEDSDLTCGLDERLVAAEDKETAN